MKKITLIVLVNFITIFSSHATQEMLINVPVCDLRSSQVTHDLIPASRLDDDFQETQLLLGERILAKDLENGWLKVELLDQFNGINPEDKRIEGYIQRDQALPVNKFEESNIVVKSLWCPIYSLDKSTILLHVTIGTKFMVLEGTGDWLTIKLPNGEIGIIEKNNTNNLRQHKSKKELRSEVVEVSKKFLEQPYLWGGRSSYTENVTDQVTGVDCSSLVQIAHAIVGKTIPRNSGFQYLASNKLDSGKYLVSDDLIFLYNTRCNRITHVMTYIGQDSFIDTQNVTKENIVRTGLGKKWFGKTFEEMQSGEVIKSLSNDKTLGRKYKVYFGTYF
ncbi:C40 family peptidase [Candidatus Babeliales bacterium]|nr:C40 family peptidase [Candidatus Babeliales bacterium]